MENAWRSSFLLFASVFFVLLVSFLLCFIVLFVCFFFFRLNPVSTLIFFYVIYKPNNSLFSVIVRVSVVLKRTVVGDNE